MGKQQQEQRTMMSRSELRSHRTRAGAKVEGWRQGSTEVWRRFRTATQRAKQSPSGEHINTAQRTRPSNQRSERWDRGVGMAALCLLLGLELRMLRKEVRRVVMKTQRTSAPQHQLANRSLLGL